MTLDLSNCSPRNLVYNGDFLLFSNRTGPNAETDYGHPDGWGFAHTGTVTVGQDPTAGACVVITKSGTVSATLSQALHEFPRWQAQLLGQTVTLAIRVRIDPNCTLAISLSDGVTTTRRVFEAKPSQEDHDVGLQLVLDSKATGLVLSFDTASPSTRFAVLEVYGNTGDTPVRYAPCIVDGVIGRRCTYLATEYPPARELSLCAAPTELTADQTRLSSVLNGRYGEGPNGRSMLPDMRGYFTRAWDNGAKVDPNASGRTAWGTGSVTGDHVGTVQPDAFASHDHPYDTFVSSTTSQPGSGSTAVAPSKANTKQTGGDETRPKNVSHLFTITWA